MQQLRPPMAADDDDEKKRLAEERRQFLQGLTLAVERADEHTLRQELLFIPPKEIPLNIGHGMSLLTHAIAYRHPTHAIKPLLDWYPELATLPYEGLLPFHLAIEYGVAADDLYYLMLAYPDAVSMRHVSGEYPLLMLLKYIDKGYDEFQRVLLRMIEIFPMACRHEHDGVFPLNLALPLRNGAVTTAMWRSFKVVISVPYRKVDPMVTLLRSDPENFYAIEILLSARPQEIVCMNKSKADLLKYLILKSPQNELEFILGAAKHDRTTSHPKRIACTRAAIAGAFTRLPHLEQDDAVEVKEIRSHPDAIKVHLEFLFGPALTLSVRSSYPVRRLMEMQSAYTGLRASWIVIRMNERPLLAAETLSESGVADGSHVQVSRKRGCFLLVLRRTLSEALCLKILKIHPDCVYEIDQKLRLPLVEALMMRAPEGVIQRLFELFPRALTTQQYLNSIPEHPLCSAIDADYSEKAFRSIAKMCKEAEQHGKSERYSLAAGFWRSPLNVAIERGMDSRAEILLEEGFSVLERDPVTRTSALECAIISRSDDRLFFHIARRARASSPGVFHEVDTSGFTLLHLAVSNNASRDVIMDLCQQNASALDTCDQDGAVPIHRALMSRASVETICAILDFDPTSVCRKDRYGNQALVAAVLHGARHGVCLELAARSPDDGHRRLEGTAALKMALDVDASAWIVQELVWSLPHDVVDEACRWSPHQKKSAHQELIFAHGQRSKEIEQLERKEPATLEAQRNLWSPCVCDYVKRVSAWLS